MNESKYKEFCIGPYSKGDVVEFLICSDTSDGFIYEPETQYWYVDEFDLIRMSVFHENTTGKIISLGEVKNNSVRKTYKQIGHFGDFNSSYIIQDRKIEVEPHPHFHPKTLPREEILFTEPT